MPKRATDLRLDTKAARERLTARREPYWRPVTVNGGITGHVSLGYRRFKGKGGWWSARLYEKGQKTQYRRLGKADDVVFADGKSVLTFSQAEQRAREVFAPPGEYVMTTQDEIGLALFIEGERAAAEGRATDELTAPATVGRACQRYVAWLKAQGKAYGPTAAVINRHILRSSLAPVRIPELTLETLETWRDGLIRRDPGNSEVERASRDSINRIVISLKAALNRETKGATAALCRSLKPYQAKGGKKISKPRDVILTAEECARLLEACEGPFRLLVKALLLTGCRPPSGELAKAKVRDFNALLGQLHIEHSKTGPRDVSLTQQAADWFAEVAAGRPKGDLLLSRGHGEEWTVAAARWYLRQATKRAQLPPEVVMYTLRHTHISHCIMAGMNTLLLARNVGTSVQMIEQVYGKYLDAVRREQIERYSFKLQG